MSEAKRYTAHWDGDAESQWFFNEEGMVGKTGVFVLASDYDRAIARIAELERDAARFVWCQNHPKEAQAMFWNYSSRKDRAKAIDAAIDSQRDRA